MLGSAKIVGFIPTKDAKKARPFYESVLGLRFVSSDKFAVVFDAGGTMLRVVPVQEFSPFPFTLLGWQVADIQKAVSALQKKGVKFERYEWFKQDALGIWAAPSGTKVAWFKDPDGNLLWLSQHI